MGASRAQDSGLWQASLPKAGSSLLAAMAASLFNYALGAAGEHLSSEQAHYNNRPRQQSSSTSDGQLYYNPTNLASKWAHSEHKASPQSHAEPRQVHSVSGAAAAALRGASYHLSSALASTLAPPPSIRSQRQASTGQANHFQAAAAAPTTTTTTTTSHLSHLAGESARFGSQASSISDYWDQFEPQALTMQQQLEAASLDGAAASGGQTSDWWTDYWSRKPYPSEYALSSITFLSCLIGTIIILIVVGNLLVCIAIFTEKSLKPTQNWFIASLAVSDMLLGAVVMPFSLARELMGYWNFGEHWCDIHEAMDVLLTTASINTLCLISLDRYWSITQAVNYLKKRTPRRGALMIAFVWVFSAAVSLPPLFGWKKQSPGSQATLTNSSNKSQQVSDATMPTTMGDEIVVGDLEAPDGPSGAGASNNDDFRDFGRPLLDSHQIEKRDYLLARLEQRQQQQQQEQDASPSSSKRQSERNRLLVARQVSASSQEPLLQDNPSAVQQTISSENSPSSHLGTTTTASKTLEQLQAIEYPQCQLSDDVGYVLYSALGSFYIPCAVMVFTYIKIFLAARSRARRTINKQSRSNAMMDKSAGGKRTRASQPPSGKLASGMQQVQSVAAAAMQNNTNSATSESYYGSPKLASGSVAGAGQLDNNDSSLPANQMTRGKVVIVERKKSLAGATLAPLTIPLYPSGDTIGTGARETGGELTTAGFRGQQMTAGDIQEQQQQDLEINNEHQQQNKCTLTTSGAHQALPSAFGNTDTNQSGSDCLLLVNPSMGAVPITRFNFQPAEDEFQSREREKQNAAKLLKALSQLGADQQVARDPLVCEIDESMKKTPVPYIQVLGGGVTASQSSGVVIDADVAESNNEMELANVNQLSTNETCFMTIEEDSDMFDAQAGRTVMMVAGSTSQQRRESVAAASSGAMCNSAASGHKSASHMVTMLPSQQQVQCTNVACLQSRQRQMLAGPATRSGSSYCGSSMTINDDDGDDDDEEYLDDDECDSIDDDDDDDDELDDDDACATDECNGYSCTLDHYGPDDCPQCQQEAAGSAASASAEDSPARCSLAGHGAPRYHSRHHTPKRRQQQRRQQQSQRHARSHQLDEQQSITGDDNLSMQDEEDSSVMGHDMLDATCSGRGASRPTTTTPAAPTVTAKPVGERRRSIVQALFSSTSARSVAGGSVAGGKQQQVAPGRKRSIINMRFGVIVGGSCSGSGASDRTSQQAQTGNRCAAARPYDDDDDDDDRASRAPNLLALAAAQQQQLCSAPQASVRNLRQNFLLKLNQLAAKSAAMAAGSDYKSKRQMSQSDRSSSQGRRGSLETSMDFGTISNVHSTDYQQETTMVDDDEAQNSNELHNSGQRFSSSGTTSDQRDQYESDQLLDARQANTGTNNAATATTTTATTTTRTSKNTTNTNTSSTTKATPSAAVNGINISSANKTAPKGAASASNNKLPTGSEESYSIQSSAGNLLERSANRLGEPKLAIIDNSANISATKQATSSMLANKKVTIGSSGSRANNRSSTIVSSTGGASNVGGQPGGKRAYLPTDSERHKRKLAKARERRATLILGLIMAAFVTSWMPFFTFYVTRALCIVCRDYVPARLASFIFWMGYCNSAINPIIYTIFNRDFRKAFRRILFRWL